MSSISYILRHPILSILYLAFFFSCTPILEASTNNSVCLNMIVKNEEQVIKQCLESIKPFINYWVIVDTGSEDRTQEIIRTVMKDIPGELHERPWVNFEFNRNEALELGRNKADYLLLIDADECLSYDASFSLPPLTKDFYHIIVRQIGSADSLRPSFIRTMLPWKWEGVLHETLDYSIADSGEVLGGILNICDVNKPSGRSLLSNKYLKDAAILEQALKVEPDNSRYVFYLAQSYLAANNRELALANYEKRALMPSTDFQETFFAIYNVGKIKGSMGDYDGALKSFFKAYEFHPKRAEPVFQAAMIYRKMNNPFLGYLLAQHALSIPYPKGENCVEYLTYDYGALVEFANCALLLKRWQEGLDACNKLLVNPSLPEEIRAKVILNYELAKKKLL